MRALNINFQVSVALLLAILPLVPVKGRAQSAAYGNLEPAATTQLPPAPVPYVQPSQALKLNNYIFQSMGPYPILRSVVMAGIHQATHNPPDWQEGLWGYGERYGSDYGISLVNVTTRYTLAEATREDVIYYPCACKGVWARLGHAFISVAIARRGADGHEVFSLPAVVAPYAGPLTAVYGWYPNNRDGGRYGAKDAFRMGNYGLLGYAGHNVTMEFLSDMLQSKRHPWIAHLHLEDLQGTPPPPIQPSAR